jgi:hypothetical protein
MANDGEFATRMRQIHHELLQTRVAQIQDLSSHRLIWRGTAVRDFGLLLGALALGRLAYVYDPAWRRHPAQ